MHRIRSGEIVPALQILGSWFALLRLKFGNFLETGSSEAQPLTGFHHWEVRKELQDAFNALINAAGQAGQHKLAESLFSEVLNNYHVEVHCC